MITTFEKYSSAMLNDISYEPSHPTQPPPTPKKNVIFPRLHDQAFLSNLFCLYFADHWAVLSTIIQGEPLLDGT